MDFRKTGIIYLIHSFNWLLL